MPPTAQLDLELVPRSCPDQKKQTARGAKRNKLRENGGVERRRKKWTG
jgi:hypothetical protein